jgi:hypothetical protein
VSLWFAFLRVLRLEVATGDVRGGKVSTFFESGNGAVNWRY